MTYDEKDIAGDRLFNWDGDDFYVLKYHPFRSSAFNDTSRLILDFKENKDDAVKVVIQLLTEAVASLEVELRDKRASRYIVSIPSSVTGKTNTPCERVCAALAGRFAWLAHIPKALVRTKSVQKSARAAAGGRPDYAAHLETITYKGPKLTLRSETIVMFDDVITRGETSRACRDILKAATGSTRVTGIYLAKTGG
jgi:predicted amidophosphoribosyltransferase